MSGRGGRPRLPAARAPGGAQLFVAESFVLDQSPRKVRRAWAQQSPDPIRGIFSINAPSRSVLSLILKVELGALSCGFCASRLIAGTAKGRTASEPAAFLFGGAVTKDAF